jgi:hypothetical protein
MKTDDADTLRRRIDYYRRRLLEGVDADLGPMYLLRISEAEIALAELEQSEPKGDRGGRLG